MPQWWESGGSYIDQLLAMLSPALGGGAVGNLAPPGSLSGAAPPADALDWWGAGPPDATLPRLMAGMPDLGMPNLGMPSFGMPSFGMRPEASGDRDSFPSLSNYASMRLVQRQSTTGGSGPTSSLDNYAQMRQFQRARQRAAQASPAPGDTGNLPGINANVTRWLPLAQKYAAAEGIPVEAVLALIHNESGGRPDALSAVNSEGRGRATGLMQLLPIYHQRPGDNLFDPETNIKRGAAYFGQAYRKRGNDLDKAMAEYFGGGGVEGAAGNIRMNIGDMNITVGNYLPKFRAATQAYKAWLDRRGQATPASTPVAAGGASDLADLWGWLGGVRQPITGRFGAQDGPYPGTGHRGMDIGTPLGTRLTSPVEGVVMAAGDVGGGYGNQVRIKTAYGSILLGHLASIAVRPGQTVTAGMALGTTGSTGKSTGPHLHFELRDERDNPIDPARYYRW